MTETEYHVSPLFTGLTRPIMVMGVTLEYVGIAFTLAMCTFILLGSPLYLILYLPLHLMGWLLCLYDPYIFSLLNKRLACGLTPNRKHYGCDRYEPS